MRMYTAKTIEEELQRAGELFLKEQFETSVAKKEVFLFSDSHSFTFHFTDSVASNL